MSYSYINDAFNMKNNNNSKIDNMQTTNNSYSNYEYFTSASINNNQSSNNKPPNNYKEFSTVNVPYAIEDSNDFDNKNDSIKLDIFNINELNIDNYEAPYDNTLTSLDGTTLTNLINENDTKQVYNDNNNNLKLTHRDCVNIYNNPEFFSDNHINFSLKHITKCAVCKQEIIKNKNIINNNNNNNNNINNNNNNNRTVPVAYNREF